MRKVLLITLVFFFATMAQDNVSVFKLGTFKYDQQKMSLIPLQCGTTAICDEIKSVVSDMMFEQFGANYLDEKKVKKALKQAQLKKLDEENMAAIANHLKVDIFVKFVFEIENISSVQNSDEESPSSLLKAEMVLLLPQSGTELLKVQSIGKSGLDSLRERFEKIFKLAFDAE